jgi:hypothetical protein
MRDPEVAAGKKMSCRWPAFAGSAYKALIFADYISVALPTNTGHAAILDPKLYIGAKNLLHLA